MHPLLASLAIATAAIPVAADAQSFGEPVVVTVSYADLNLDAAAGIATFNGRVRSAADQLCRDAGLVPVNRARLEAECVTSVIKSAKQQLRSGTAKATIRAAFAAR